MAGRGNRRQRRLDAPLDAIEQAVLRRVVGARERVHDRIVATIAAMPAAARVGDVTTFDSVLSELP